MSADAAAGGPPEDFSAASGATVQTRGLESFDDRLIRHSANASEVIQLDHREGLEVHVGKVALKLGQQGRVVVELQARVKTADDIKFARALLVGLAGDLTILAYIPFVSFRMT